MNLVQIKRELAPQGALVRESGSNGQYYLVGALLKEDKQATTRELIPHEPCPSLDCLLVVKTSQGAFML